MLARHLIAQLVTLLAALPAGAVNETPWLTPQPDHMVLVVEDHADSAEAIAFGLETAGCTGSWSPTPSVPRWSMPARRSTWW
jgi:hypothetical protein